MPARRISAIAHAILLPLVLSMVRTVHFSTSASAAFFVMEVLERDEFLAMEMSKDAAFFAWAFPLISAIAVAVLGPYAGMVLGSLLLAGALGLLSTMDPSTWQGAATSAILATGLGSSMVWVSVMTAAVLQVPESLGNRRIPVLACSLSVLVATVEMAGLLGGVGGMLLADAWGYSSLFAVGAMVALLAAGISVGLAVVGRRIERPTGRAVSGLRTPAVIGLALLLALAVLPLVNLWVVALSSLASLGTSGSDIGLVNSGMGILGLVGALTMAIAWGLVAWVDRPGVDAGVVGVAMVGFAATGLLVTPSATGLLGATAAMVAIGGTSLAHGVLMPPLYARLTTGLGGVHWRWIPISLGVYGVLRYCASWAFGVVHRFGGESAVAVGAFFVVGVLGVVTLGLGVVFREALDESSVKDLGEPSPEGSAEEVWSTSPE